MAAALHRAYGVGPAAAVERVAAAEEAVSGRRPLGEGMRVALHDRAAGASWFWLAPGQAYAGMAPGEVPGVELTADPDAPGAAAALLERLRAHVPHARLWCHGERSAALAAARALRLRQTRQLWVMVRELARVDAAAVPPGVRLRSFDRERDFSALLALNRVVFAHLPDQAAMDAADLAGRLAAPWHRPDGFIVAERGGRLVGFHWTKIDPRAAVAGVASGEVYLIAVSAQERGAGLAAALLAAGLRHLADRGLRRVHLFVDAGNTAAVRRYESSGFSRWDSDRQFEW